VRGVSCLFVTRGNVEKETTSLNNAPGSHIWTSGNWSASYRTFNPNGLIGDSWATGASLFVLALPHVDSNSSGANFFSIPIGPGIIAPRRPQSGLTNFLGALSLASFISWAVRSSRARPKRTVKRQHGLESELHV
jgi:hypothetical protein